MGVAVGDYDNDGYLDLFVTALRPRHAAITTTATARSPTSRRRPGVARPALEHERRVRRLRPRRRSRSLRRQLSGLHARRQQAVQRRGRRARLLRPARVPAGAAIALFRNDGDGTFADVTERRRHQRRPTAPVSASRSATTTATAGPISTSPTTRRRTSSGSTSTTARSSTRAAVRGGGERGGQSRRAAWGSRRATSIATATRICSSPTSSAKRSRSTSTTDAATSRTRAREPAWRAPTAAFTGFGTDWIDYDNDGWLDLFVANGAVNIDRGAARAAASVPHDEPAVPQHRRHGALRRNERRGGPAFARAEIGRGARVRRHRQRRRRRHRRHDQRRAGAGCCSTRRRATNHWLEIASRPAAREPLRHRRLDRRRARRTADALAPRADRRQLSVGERRARAFRARARRPRSTPSPSNGPTACANAGPVSPPTRS